MAINRLAAPQIFDIEPKSALDTLNERRVEREKQATAQQMADSDTIKAQEYARAGQATRANEATQAKYAENSPPVELGPNATQQDVINTFREQLQYWSKRDPAKAQQIWKGLQEMQGRMSRESEGALDRTSRETVANTNALSKIKPPPTARENAADYETDQGYYDQAITGITGAQFEANEDGESVPAVPINRLSDEYAMGKYNEAMNMRGANLQDVNRVFANSYTFMQSDAEEQVLVPNSYAKEMKRTVKGIDDATIASMWERYLTSQRSTTEQSYEQPPQQQQAPKPYENADMAEAREGREVAQAGRSREQQEAYKKWKKAGEGYEYHMSIQELGAAYMAATPADRLKIAEVIRVKNSQNGR